MLTLPTIRLLTMLAINISLIAPGEVYAKPCECKEIDAMTAEIQRVSNAQAIWREIFAWARGLHRDVAEPKSNDELNTKFLQLARAPRSDWDRIIREPIQQIERPRTAGGLDQNGEVIVNDDFAKSHCDEIVEGVRVHERAHEVFYRSLGLRLQGGHMIYRLLRTRAESDVISYTAQKTFLEKELEALRNRCKYTITAISRWHVEGEANLNIVATIQDAGMTAVEAGGYKGTAGVSWVITGDRVGDCTGTITAAPSQAELNGQVDGSEMFTVNVAYRPATFTFVTVCANPEATIRGTHQVQWKPDPIIVSIPASGGGSKLPQALQGDPGYVVLSVGRGNGQ